jgi:tetratricopeptide (TPR) repeat protein
LPVREADQTPEHFGWLVEGRSANQSSTLNLYRLIDSGQRALNGNAELFEAAKELTGIAFSLWRAVFLSDTTGEYEDEMADLRKFLISLISDDTVLYVTDKNARNWSFRYYLDNALHRLRKLSEGRLRLVSEENLASESETEKDEWQAAQRALETALRRFEEALNAVESGRGSQQGAS